MARILVAGGLYTDDNDKKLGDAREQFAAAIGREIVNRGHVLLGGCRTGLDAVVANAAAKAAVAAKKNPRTVVRSWVSKNTTTPCHDVGEITRSRVEDWRQVPRRYTFPEPIQEADVVVILGGWDGTHYAASWARLANKPIVPVAAFGLAAAEIFDDEVAAFERRPSRLSLEEFQILNRVLQSLEPDALDQFAKEVVALAERLITPTEAFVIMSFADKGNLRDAYDTFVRVCDAARFTAFKIDHHFDRSQRIVPAIVSAIRRSAFIIADVSEPRPNVYYELGYAQALGKDVIVTAAEGTPLPFDIYDVPTLYWDSQGALASKLKVEVDRIALKFGRDLARAGG